MKYDDSIIPRRCVVTTAAGGLETVEQVLLMKIDNVSPVGELRRKLRLIEQFDQCLQALVSKGYVRFDSPTTMPSMQAASEPAPAREAKPLPTTARQAEELSRVLDALAAEKRKAERRKTAKSAMQADAVSASDDAEQSAYLLARKELMIELAQDADDLMAAGILFALENNQKLTDFRQVLQKQIRSAQGQESELLVAFERHFEAMVRMAHTQREQVVQSVESQQGPVGLICKDLDELA